MAPTDGAGAAIAGRTPAVGSSSSGSDRRTDMHEIRDRLWLGSYTAACDRPALAERRVTHVLTVGLKVDLLGARQRLRLPPSEKDAVHRLIIAIQDTSSARLDRHFDACSDFILEGLAQGGAVFVHCQAGQSRSPAVVAAYLMREERLTALEAVESIRQRRPMVQPNMGFRDQLHSLELRLGLSSEEEEALAGGSTKSSSAPTIAASAVELGKNEDASGEAAESQRDSEGEGVERMRTSSGVSDVKEVAAVDVFGTNELKARSEKLKAKCQQLRNSSGLLSLAAPLRKRRQMSRPRSFGHMRRGPPL